MILSKNLHKITFIVFECHRSIAKSVDFSFLLLSFMITNSLIKEIQNLAVNPKSRLVKSHSEQYQFLISNFGITFA